MAGPTEVAAAFVQGGRLPGRAASTLLRAARLLAIPNRNGFWRFKGHDLPKLWRKKLGNQ